MEPEPPVNLAPAPFKRAGFGSTTMLKNQKGSKANKKMPVFNFFNKY